ncbi:MULTISPECIES: hypothetical protein [Dyella]|uniref:hypothetical protein n=1 Tax=Dyella TaxID=231454 RepID=UPI0013F15992|nr:MULTISPECIES: hypothetical protein [Dyella]
MKFESLMLKGLFAACLLVCALTMGSMVFAKAPSSAQVIAHAAPAAAATLSG